MNRLPCTCDIRFSPWLACALLLCVGPTYAWCQSRQAFEFDPYRVQIWVAVEPSPQLAISPAQLANQLTAQADQVFGATWQVQGKSCALPLARRLFDPTESILWEDLPNVADLAELDKLMLVGVRAIDGAGVEVVAREFDVRSRSCGAVERYSADQADNISSAALAGMVAAFAPMVRIEGIANNQQQARLRAGGLIEGDDASPAALAPGDLLVPVVRRNDKFGEPREGGLLTLPHTYLQVAERQGFEVACQLHSGLRGGIPPKGNRVERFALRVRAQQPGTRLRLQAHNSDPPELVDYEVLARPAGSKEEPTPIGTTDLRGEVFISLAEQPLQMVYIRHGEQMLARVPIVPGLLPEQTITLTSDDERLLAESYYAAMQSTLMDLVARREVLAARIRLRLDNDDVKGAQDMLTELRNMTTRADLLKQLESQQATYKSADRLTQAKVDKMFGELRKLLAKHLDPKLLDELVAEVSATKPS